MSPTSPVFQAEKVVQVMTDKRRDFLQVVGAHPGGQQGLVGISECGVHQQEALVGTHGLGEALRTIAQQDVTESYRRIS